MKSIGHYLYEKTLVRLALYLTFQAVMLAAFVRYAGLKITPGLVIFLLPIMLSPMIRSLSGRELRISIVCFSGMALISWGIAFSSVLWSAPPAAPNTVLFPLAFAVVFTVIAGEAFLRSRRAKTSVER